MRKRVLSLLLVATAIAALLVTQQVDDVPPPRPAAQVQQPAQASPQLPSRAGLGEQRGDPFAPRSWEPPAAPAQKQAAAAPPAPPPNPYRYAGRVVHEGVEKVLLAKGDALIPVHAGMLLEDGYRVESIADGVITLRYLPLGTQQELPAKLPEKKRRG